MTAGTRIYYRGYATNSASLTGYSPDGSFYTEPSAQASGVNFSGVGPNSMTVNWSRGTAGDGVIVLMKASTAVAGTPADGTYSAYTANTAFGSGTLITDGYVVFKGAGTSVAVTGLVAGTTYHVAVYEYKGAVDTAGVNQGTNYLLTPATGSQAATAAVAPTLTTPTATAIGSTTATLGATVTSNGGTTLTARGTCWDVTAAPLANCVAEGGTTVAAFTQARTGLTAGSKLYYRGYATNTAGTGYSPDGSFYTEPSAQASGVTFPSAGLTSMTINWTRGTGGDGVIVLVKVGLAVDANPTDGSYNGYTANAAFGSGTQIGTGNYVVFKGAGTSVTVTGLTAGSTYHVAVYEYKGAVDTAGVDQGTNYLLTPATGSQMTLAPPTDAKIVYSIGTTTPQNRTYTTTSNTFGTAAATTTGAAQRFVVTKASAKRNEYLSGYVTDTGVLYVQRWNGIAWSAEWNVTVGGNGVNGRRFDIIYENISGDAVVVYSTNVDGSAGNEMAYRIWNGTAWSAETTFASARLNQAAAVTWVKLAARPGSDEIALLAEDEGTTGGNNSRLTSLIWSGAAWGNEPATSHSINMYNSTAPAVQNDCIDLAYESISGDLLVVWTQSTPEQYYRTYSGGTWGAATSYNTGRGAPLQMIARANPDTNEILVAFNRTGSTSVYANVWTGAGVGTTTTVSNTNGVTTATNRKQIAGDWLSLSGTNYAVVIWQTNNGTPNQGTIGYNRFSAGAWGTAATYNTGVDSALQWMDLDADPFSRDRFMLTYSNAANDLYSKRLVVTAGPTFTWSSADGGTALTAALASITAQNFDFAYSPYTTGPTLSISQPDGTGDTIAKDATYTVTYSLSDPDDVVTAALYYDVDTDGTGGTAIAGCGAVPEGTGATCAWGTTGVAPGTYYVYGVANDGVNPAVTRVSPGMVTINGPPTLSISQPDGVGDSTPASTNYNIAYTLTDADNVVTTAFYYDTNADMTGGVAIAGCSAAAEGTGVTCSWDTAGMTAGDYYVYGVTSGDALNPQVKAVSPGVISITAPPPSQDDKLVYSINTTTPQFREYTNSSNSFNAETTVVAGATNQRFVVTKSSATRDEYITGYVTSGGVLYILRWNGTSWNAEWNVTVGGDGVNGRRFDIIYENLSGDAMVVYSTNATGTAGNEMAYRVWNGATWTAAANITSARLNQNATVSWVKLAARPGSDEIALLASDSGTTTANTALLTSLIWSGTAWGNEPGAAHTPNPYIPNTTGQLVQNDCFDLAYESLSGDLLVVFSTYNATGPAGQQYYRTYSAGAWGTSTSYGTARLAPQQMIARSNPNTDQILVAFNRSGSANVYGNVWTGTGVGTTTTVGANGVTTAINKKTIGGGWLNLSGTDYAVVVWQTNTGTPNQGTIGYNRYSGAAWGTAATYNTGVDSALQWLDIDTDPFNSDRLMLTYSNAASDLYAKRLVVSAGPTFTWSNADGGAALTAALASITSQNFDFAYARRINCVEVGTVAINALPGTISAPTAINATAGGGATAPQVRWNQNGGTWSAWQNSGAIYAPAGCSNGTLNVEARATGTCAQITATPASTTYNTQDTDLATLTVTGPLSPVTGIKTVQVQVGAEGSPSTLSAVVVNITNAGACNVSNGFMAWSGATSRWEYTWDTSACGTAAVVNNVSIVASANDPDCGNAVTSPARIVTIDNTCVDAASTVTWTVPGAPVTSPLVVTAAGSAGVTAIEVSFDDGTTWQPNGSTYTPKIDTVGTSIFRFRALDTCDKRIYGGSTYTTTSPGAAYNVPFDGRLNRIRPLEITAEAAGKTSIRIQMNYCSDKNDNAQTTLRYKLTSAPDLPANWITIGPVVDGADADGLRNQAVLFMLTGLTTDTSFDIELSVTETAPDVVDWTTIQGDQPTAPPWKATIQLTSWLDSPLMHNALRFACSKIGYANQADCITAGGTWNLDRKWPGGWGLPNATYPNAQYESFECSTCHVKDSSNVKRVITAVTPKADGPFPGSAISLRDVREGTAEFGDDSDSHVTSDRACEVCHSKTTYHRQDTTLQTNKLHNNKTDCIRCHEHNVGFRASCDSCHGTPPVDATGLATDPAPTGSTVWGEHQKHAVDIGYDCNTCHGGWDSPSQMPKQPTAGNINIGFKVDVNPQFTGAVNAINGGTYEGRTTGGGYTAAGIDGTPATIPPTAVNTATGAMTCAVYCHGYGRPVWNPTSSQPCGSCHGKVNSGVGYQSGAPTGVNGSKDLAGQTTGLQVGKHAVHLDDSVAQTGDPCALCHSGFGYIDSTHVNGTINVLLRQEAKIEGSGTTGGAGINAVYNAVTGKCENMECHGSVSWNSSEVLNCTQSCHNYPPVGVTAGLSIYPATTPVSHDTRGDGGAYLKANHKGCLYCHGWNDNGSGALPITGATAAQITVFGGDPAEAPNFTTYSAATNPIGQHMDGKITMNDDGDGNTANDADYDPTTGGCDNAVCHPNDATHRLTLPGTLNQLEVQADIGPGDCAECHATGVGGATVVKIASTGSSAHTDADGPYGSVYTVNVASPTAKCTNCHSGHYTKPGGVKIPNNAAVGINYLGTQHGGINIGGPGTIAWISAKTTEAETCWGCHDNVDSDNVTAGIQPVSEWGVNNKMTGSPVATQYNYGTLSTSDWTAATWSSGKGATFAYKTGAIQSTHAANSIEAGATSALTGTTYAYKETKDDKSLIRCSYCHDVHDAGGVGVGPTGKPYLRGTWWSNPYEEDGAPQAGQVFENILEYGAVPRGGQTTANMAKRLGGFWIDVNNVRPGTASTTVNGTPYANPTITGGTGTGGAWTLSDSAGLCVLCHTNNVNTMDQKTGEALWFGTNGHANATIGGTGTASGNAANIFELRGSAGTTSITINPPMHFKGTQLPGDSGTSTSYRNGTTSTRNYTPSINAANSESTRPFQVELWGAAMSYDNTTTNSQYHKFSCSKCHNPHASRLPKLMITNCLDTKHNTWDDSYQLNTDSTTSINYNRSLSNWTTAQNCHRVGGIVPATRIIPATGGTYPEPVDAGAVAAPAGTLTDYQNRGWNTVTPW